MSNLNISGSGSGVESLSISSDSSGPKFCNFWNDLMPKLRRANLDRCAYYRKEFDLQGHEFQIDDVFEEKDVDLKGVAQSHSNVPASNTESTDFLKAAIERDTTTMDTTESVKDASSEEVCLHFSIYFVFKSRAKQVLKETKALKQYRFKQDIQIPTRIPEKIVVALFSGILVNSGILVVAGTVLTSK